MFRRGRVRPSRGQALIGMLMGTIFVIIGFTIAIPNAGLFGVFWTLMAIIITGTNVYNFFSKEGISYYEVDLESTGEDFDSKLRKIKKLKDDGIISEEEYNLKKDEIMREKW
ncbi:SHOCT domain-containing protein [Clostridium malenominatum]|uniref:SHOCT domain-containing protein n=1 Tax=Clostridium malenominatum TaxID=1539 RepID=A0ABN1J5S3_9CLOT